MKDGKTLQNIVAYHAMKAPAKVDVLRDGQKMTIDVTVEEQPKEFGRSNVPAPRRTPTEPQGVALDKLGLEVNDMTTELADNLGFRAGTKGVVITKVEPNSVAAEKGLRRGMLVTRVDNAKVANVEAARKSLENVDLSRGVLLQVQSPSGGTNFVLLKQEG